jgi:hypothetical protein
MASINRRDALLHFANHGVSDLSLRPALTLTQEVRQLMLAGVRGHQLEFAGAIDVESGERLGELVSGEEDAVDASPLLAAARGRAALFIHSHPGSSAFSDSDVALLLTESCVVAIAAVGANGDLHLLSKTPGTPLPSVPQMKRIFQDTVDELAEIYDALPALGYSSEQQWQEHSYDVWQRIAPALDLRV